MKNLKRFKPGNYPKDILWIQKGSDLTVRGLAFGRESPPEPSRLNVSLPDAKPFVVGGFLFFSLFYLC